MTALTCRHVRKKNELSPDVVDFNTIVDKKDSVAIVYHTKKIFCTCFGPKFANFEYILSGSSDGLLILWKYCNSKVAPRTVTSHVIGNHNAPAIITSCIFNSTGTRAFSADSIGNGFFFFYLFF